MIVITTTHDGTFYNYEAIREQIDENGSVDDKKN